MLISKHRGERAANHYLDNKEAIFRKHGLWLWYDEVGYSVYVPIMFLDGVKSQKELQEKLKKYCEAEVITLNHE
jgi:hypothetical protein